MTRLANFQNIPGVNKKEKNNLPVVQKTVLQTANCSFVFCDVKYFTSHKVRFVFLYFLSTEIRSITKMRVL